MILAQTANGDNVFTVVEGLGAEVTAVINTLIVVLGAILFISALRKGVTWPVVLSAAVFIGFLIFAVRSPELLSQWVGAIFPTGGEPAEAAGSTATVQAATQLAETVW